MWYQIQNVLGRGGFGFTYLAYDNNLDHKVAIKEYVPFDWANRIEDASVRPISTKHEQTFDWGLNNFISEAQTLAKFKHPNIVRVLSVFKELNTAYMVMEYEQGEELSSQIKRGEEFTEKRLLEIVIPLIEGLEVVHLAGFIHRDIKPSNIMIRADGSPVLIDFGSARQAIGVHTRTLTSMLTFGYAPFEQYDQGSEKQGPWTDIYALAATLYYAATGQVPVESIKRASAVVNGEADCLVPASELAAGRYSEGFLQAIDAGLGFRTQDRPQSLGVWREMLLGHRCVEDFSPIVPTPTGDSETTVLLTRDPTVLLSEDKAKEMAKLRHLNDPPPDADKAKKQGTNKTVYGVTAILLIIAVAVWFVVDGRNPILVVEQYLNDTAVPVAVNESASPVDEVKSAAAEGVVKPGADSGTLVQPPALVDQKLELQPKTGSYPGSQLSDPKAEPGTGPEIQQLDAESLARQGPAIISKGSEAVSSAVLPLTKENLLAGNASLQITSRPAGASVTLNGIKIGTTPFYSEELLEGEYELVLDAKNYRNHSQTITVNADSAVKELVNLTPKQVDVTIKSEPAGAWVELNGERVAGLTPVTLAGIEPGSYNIKVGKTDFETSSVNVFTSRGEVYERTFRLTPIEYGQLTIIPNVPNALVKLPELTESYHDGMKLPVGDYRVEVFARNYQRWADRLTLTTDGLETPVELQFIYQVGDSFRDYLQVGGRGPELVILPQGSFIMGSVRGAKSETPKRRVNITRTFAIMKHEVTIADFQKFVDFSNYQTDAEKAGGASGCRVNQDGFWVVKQDVNWKTSEFNQSDSHPVSCLSWNDAQAYASWLSDQTGENYRLPSEAEWEYAARAGSAGNYVWGENEPVCSPEAENGANFNGEGCVRGPEVTGKYRPNSFGLFDMHGNVWEWVADCWHPNYANAPKNGIVWAGGDCGSRVLRGGSWTNSADYLRLSTRGVAPRDDRDISYGFRLVRELDS